MHEAENYYDTEEGYYKFKKKYSNLYFPEYGDDYSAYLPVKDKYVAKLLNSKGEVMINGNIVNLVDIYSYDQINFLQESEATWKEFHLPVHCVFNIGVSILNHSILM